MAVDDTQKSVPVLAAKRRNLPSIVGTVLESGSTAIPASSTDIERHLSIGSRSVSSYWWFSHDNICQEWNGEFFERQSLTRDLKQDVQLGHISGLRCPFREAAHKDFVIIDVNSIHQINLFFCGCNDAPSEVHQLLEVGWWPSMPRSPASAATFTILRTCQILNHNEHSALTDFYKGLEQITCGKGLTALLVSLILICLNLSGNPGNLRIV